MLGERSLAASTPPPSMAIEADVTSLLGSKRKRPNAVPKLKPVLKGVLSSHNNKVTWSGCWSLTKDTYSDIFAENVVRAPFYFERKALTSENHQENGVLSRDGYFNGYFCMQDLSRPTLNCSYKKFYEKEVLLRFTKVKGSTVSFDVVGSGQNKFGKYLIEGKFDSNTNEINCARNYIQVLKKPPSPSRKRLESPKNGAKRSSRIRIPSAKYIESYGLEQIRNSPLANFDFEGKKEINEILLALKEKDISGRINKICEALEKKRIRSLKSAYKHLVEYLACSKNIIISKDLLAKLTLLQNKYQLKPIKTKTVKTEKANGNFEDSYISVFEDLKEMQQIDPLGFNPSCRLPERLRSPTLSRVVDLKNVFDKCMPPLSLEASSHELQNVTKEEELYPISDVDFSDLSTLDADTLKELNEYVEFTCPSKGA